MMLFKVRLVCFVSAIIYHEHAIYDVLENINLLPYFVLRLILVTIINLPLYFVVILVTNSNVNTFVCLFVF